LWANICSVLEIVSSVLKFFYLVKYDSIRNSQFTLGLIYKQCYDIVLPNGTDSRDIYFLKVNEDKLISSQWWVWGFQNDGVENVGFYWGRWGRINSMPITYCLMVF
jgi:hypothetical protein